MPAPARARLQVDGIVGQKGNVFVELHTTRNLLALHTPTAKDAVAEIEGIDCLLTNEFGLDLSQVIWYYEFGASLIIKALSNPVEIWADRFQDLPLIGEFSQILGMDLAPLGVRLAKKGKAPNSDDWFDLQIIPQIQAGETRHLVQFVFRSPKRDEFLVFIKRFDRVLGQVMDLIEKG